MQNGSKLLKKRKFNNNTLGAVNFRRGIFRGDSLSPMLFLICLLPLTTLLKKSGLDFTIHNVTISHLLCVDDLKLVKDILALTKIVKTFSNDICMQIGLDKCATVTINRGQVVRGDSIKLPPDEVIDPLPLEESYKHLGILEHGSINNIDVKKKAKMEFKKRLHQLLKSKPKADVGRLNVLRRKGGRGLKSIEDLVFKEQCALSEYLKHSTTPALKLVSKEKFVEKGMRENQTDHEDHFMKWKAKALHGKWAKLLKIVDEDSSKWLRTAHLKPPTEAFIIAVQDQALHTNWLGHYVLKTGETTDKCRRCKKFAETVMHIVSGCPMLAQGVYHERHTQVASALHWDFCGQYQLPRGQHWWEHKPEPVTKNVLWDFTMRLDRLVEARKPDILLIQKVSGSNPQKITIIDIACPWDETLAEKEEEKISKYQPLRMELERAWGGKVKVPIVVGTLGALPKTLKGYL
uniref:Reverse transcriptase domain-containing protein n=1 Tax=Latimeria chalumnae TaxID=7897 RepID=H3APX3_LATCH